MRNPYERENVNNKIKTNKQNNDNNNLSSLEKCKTQESDFQQMGNTGIDWRLHQFYSREFLLMALKKVESKRKAILTLNEK